MNSTWFPSPGLFHCLREYCLCSQVSELVRTSLLCFQTTNLLNDISFFADCIQVRSFNSSWFWKSKLWCSLKMWSWPALPSANLSYSRFGAGDLLFVILLMYVPGMELQKILRFIFIPQKVYYEEEGNWCIFSDVFRALSKWNWPMSIQVLAIQWEAWNNNLIVFN